MDKILEASNERSPQYNRYILETFREESINKLPYNIERAWISGLKLINNQVTYIGYEVVGPLERARHEMNSFSYRYKGRVVSILHSEVSLIKYKFLHNNKEYHCHMYVPYLKDRCLFIEGKRMSLILAIVEQVFTRFSKNITKGKVEILCEGVMIRPIRTPVEFYRYETLCLRAEGLGNTYQFSDFIVTGKLYSKKSSSNCVETSIVLYLICKFGFHEFLRKVGLNPKDFVFRSNYDESDKDFWYFSSNPYPKKTHTHPIYLSVRKGVIENSHLAKRIVANIMYTLRKFTKVDFGDLNDPNSIMFPVLLGKLINGKRDYPEMEALNSTENHLNSIDTLIDPVSQERFSIFLPDWGKDIYDIMFYLLTHMDELLVNKDPKDLFSKRIDVATSLLIEAYAKPINNKIYDAFKSDILRQKEVTDLFNIPNNMIFLTINNNQKGETSRTINHSPSIPNDSWIACCGIDKHRPDGGPKTPFDPSMAVVESILSFTGNRIGDTGSLNPFCEIDAQGRIIQSEDFTRFVQTMKYILRK